MTDYFNSQLNPQKLKDYLEKDLDYKDQARNIICERLGYEPPLYISILSEIILRGAYRQYALGEKPIDELESNIKFHIKFLNRLMINEAPSYNC